jgi:hypothetical protein
MLRCCGFDCVHVDVVAVVCVRLCVRAMMELCAGAYGGITDLHPMELGFFKTNRCTIIRKIQNCALSNTQTASLFRFLGPKVLFGFVFWSFFWSFQLRVGGRKLMHKQVSKVCLHEEIGRRRVSIL